MKLAALCVVVVVLVGCMLDNAQAQIAGELEAAAAANARDDRLSINDGLVANAEQNNGNQGEGAAAVP